MKTFTSIPQGLHLDICMFWSFLNVCIPLRVHTVMSTVIMFLGRVHDKKPKRKLHVGSKSQAILEEYLLCLMLILEDCWMLNKPSQALL